MPEETDARAGFRAIRKKARASVNTGNGSHCDSSRQRLDPTVSIRVEQVTNAAVREQVYRFRYDIYVREMRRRQRYADDARQRIVDPLDGTGIVFAAIDSRSGHVVGTARTNFLKHGRVPEYERLYGIDQRRDLRATDASITTRLMVAPQYRRSIVTHQLVKALFVRALDEGVVADFIDCNDPHVPFFERLGYRRVNQVEHDEYGCVNVMQITLADTAHLKSVGSPFFALVKARSAISTEPCL